MKYLLIISLHISILSLTANAQIQKGAILTGGIVSFSTQDSDEDQTSPTGFTRREYNSDFLILRPKVGIFVSESLLLGLGIQYEYRYSRSSTSLDGTQAGFSIQKSNLILVNPHIQKYYRLADDLFFSPTLNILIGVETVSVPAQIMRAMVTLLFGEPI
ncbi:MAG: hypothetical protein MJA83_03075 [Gammaproteobacteria bacterium]|nr:hypothetical protein [Gammaproteobacteria bacterium]